MTPGKYDLKVYRGDTYAWTFRLWADAIDGIPVDLSGAEAAAEIREKASGSTIVDLAVSIELPNEILVGLATPEWDQGIPLSGAWDLQVTYPGGVIQTVVAGRVAVTPDVTDSTVVA